MADAKVNMYISLLIEIIINALMSANKNASVSFIINVCCC